jgi:catechol 2,3-dioxygenase-like lactoylglutathione lyase family enzyme
VGGLLDDRSMIHHIDIAVRDLARSRAFYDSALATLGLTRIICNRHDEGYEVLGYGVLPDPVFWIRNGRPAVTRLHIAFLAPTRDAVDAFYAAGLDAGGIANGAPGPRPRYAENYYAAFVLDPDGHNIEAVCRS